MGATGYLGLICMTWVGAHAARVRVQADIPARKLGNFVLGDRLLAVPLGLTDSRHMATSLLEQGDASARALPPYRFDHPLYKKGSYLRRGSFGAVYKATREGNPDEELVVKFLYVFRGEALNIVTGSEEDRNQFSDELDALENECKELQEVHEHREKNRVGASRLITCRASCFVGSTDCPTDASSAQFIVMDYGGIPGDLWMDDHHTEHDQVAIVLDQVRQGLQYLSQVLEPPLCHHDLKWENIAIRENRDGTMNTFLIDFGAAMRITELFSEAESTSSKYFAAPEWKAKYAWYGPPHAFDTWALGIMALEGLCGDTIGDVEALTQTAISTFPLTFQYDLEGPWLTWLRENGFNTPCALSLSGLLSPDPGRRLSPDKYILTETGLQLTGDGSLNLKRLPPGGGRTFNVLVSLRRQLSAATKDKEPTWESVHMPHKPVEGSHCMMADPRWKDLKDKWPAPLQMNDTQELNSNDKKTIWGELLERVKTHVLSPLTNDDDTAFCACVWYTVQARSQGSLEESIGGLALLQWAEALRDRIDRLPTKGDQFAYGLIWSIPGERFHPSKFGQALAKVAVKAARLFEVAGRVAVPGWKSTWNTMFSFKLNSRYRLLYRRLYYLVNARLQAAAAVVRCGVQEALTGRDAVMQLFALGHEFQKMEFGTGINTDQELHQVLDVAEAMQEAFIERSSSPVHVDIPDISVFDNTQGWSSWEDEGSLNSFAPRDKTSVKFEVFWKEHCKSSAPPPFPMKGLYRSLRDHVVQSLEAGKRALEGIVHVSRDRSSSGGQVVEKLGKDMVADVKKASKSLYEYAVFLNKDGYNDINQNADELQQAVREKLRHGNHKVIKYVTELLDAIDEVKVHPLESTVWEPVESI